MRRFRVVSILVSLSVAAAVLVVADQQAAMAANPANFDAGYIISDANFYDSNAMSQTEIQAFLSAKGSGLAHLRFSVASRAKSVSDTTDNVRCEAFTGGTDLPASTIIFRAQQACGISAKVILVTLQKEQALIAKASPSQDALDRAMGMACPDTAPCAVDKLGFGNQVYEGAKQLHTYKASRFGTQPGLQTRLWHPDAIRCGSSTFVVQNHATAALYNYTPYRPNAAALANLYGTGDACSSYGNRNFWVFYSDWFGSPTGPVNPVGNLEIVSSTSPSAVRVAGWAFDYDTPNSIDLHVYVDGAFAKYVKADGPRSDINAAYPGMPGNYGFSSTLAVAPGSRNVCVYAINVGPGSVNTQLGCRRVVVAAPLPAEPASTELAAVYRFWSDTYKAHFYTRSVAERNDVIKNYSDSVWKYEAAVFGAFGTQVEGTVPLYRFWSSAYNGHFYTTSEGEKNDVIAQYPDHIWKYEAVAFYVYPSSSSNPETVPMARFWSPTYRHHFYTADAVEAKQVTDLYSDEIWTPEGNVFRVARTVPQAAPLP